MTRKDFILIANAMKEATTFAIYKQSAEARSQHALTCGNMAYELAIRYERFNVVKFLQACGLDEETIQNL